MSLSTIGLIILPIYIWLLNYIWLLKGIGNTNRIITIPAKKMIKFRFYFFRLSFLFTCSSFRCSAAFCVTSRMSLVKKPSFFCFVGFLCFVFFF